MSPHPRSGWVWYALTLPALVFVAAWCGPAPGPPRPAVVDAGDLAADPGARRGREVVVTGEWVMTTPAPGGYLVVVVRGRAGGRAVCHFEDVPAADRAGLEARLVRMAEVTIRGRCDGAGDGTAVLRGCRLLD